MAEHVQMSSPIALFSSCCENCDILSTIINPLRKSNATSEVKLLEDVVGYSWNIDTKYYTADVIIATAKRPTIGNEEFAENVQAVGLVFDPNEENSFQKINTWIAYINSLEPFVSLLICNKVTDNTTVSRSRVLAWCIDNNFELIEINPEFDQDDSEDDFADIFGIARIKQALFAHTWPNLILKDNPKIRSAYMCELMAKEKEIKTAETTKENLTCFEDNFVDFQDLEIEREKLKAMKTVSPNSDIKAQESVSLNDNFGDFQYSLFNTECQQQLDLAASKNSSLNSECFKSTNISTNVHCFLDNAAMQEQNDQLNNFIDNEGAHSIDFEKKFLNSNELLSENVFSEMKSYMVLANKHEVGSEERHQVATEAITHLCKKFELCDDLDDSSNSD